ncbi:MAG: amino acid ABC transporter permease [Clostridiales bacterium]|nr:amino acid ABC transporter permease [Clostridiales bacterium]
MSYIIQLTMSMLDGIKYTVGLFGITLLLSMPIGLILCFVRSGKNKVLSSVVGAYVWLMRGTPLLLQLYFFCYGLTFLPFVGQYLVMGRFQSACVAFVLNYAAYFCEIFRGGMLSVDTGQFEAAKVLGFSKWQANIRIIIPQMLKVSLPPISNESITLVKDTALVTAIGITEILYFAKSAVNRDVNVSAYIVAAAFFLALTYALTALFKYLENKFSF